MIQLLSSKIPVRFLCKYFGISSSSYYQWTQRIKCNRLITKENILLEIRDIFRTSKETYGSPRIYSELVKNGHKISENTVAKYMKELGLDARLKKKFRILTTNSNHSGPIAPRLFKTEEKTLPELPGKVLAGDITYLNLGNTFCYLAVVMDLFNREIIGWSMSSRIDTQIVLNALDMAIKKVGPDAEVIFHSDRGSQYASEAYRNFLKKNHVLPSMSRKGNCYDNAYVESWFASLKKECVYRSYYSTEADLRNLVFAYIETWYNRKRQHSALGFMSPESYKEKMLTA